jgi:MerR HTH family regulatory protein
VVQEVTLSPVEVPRRMTRVQVLWQTGAISDFTVPRKDKYVALATSPEALALLKQLFIAKKTDIEIAKELDRRGFKTGVGRRWGSQAVQRARYDHGMYRESKKARRVPLRRADGMYSVRAVAARIDVPPSVVRYWARHGVLEPAERGGPGRPHWFVLDPATLDHLKEARTKCHTLPRREEQDAGAPRSAQPARSRPHRAG